LAALAHEQPTVKIKGRTSVAQSIRSCSANSLLAVTLTKQLVNGNRKIAISKGKSEISNSLIDLWKSIMKVEDLPYAYIVYLHGNLFASSSNLPFRGHKHVVTRKRLDPAQLRRATKVALLVDLYRSGIIDFEIREEKKRFSNKMKKEVFVKLLKEVDQLPDFGFNKLFLMLLQRDKEVKLEFRVMKWAGVLTSADKNYMDLSAKEFNRELAQKTKLIRVQSRRARYEFAPNLEDIEHLKDVALRIKEEMSEFKEKNPELYELLSREI